MFIDLQHMCLLAIVIPLVGSILAGVFAKEVGPIGAHRITIFGVAISFILSLVIACNVLWQITPIVNTHIYTWADGGGIFPYAFHMGLLLDPLTVVMMVVVTFVSLLVHIYSIGYMTDDPSYQRFFSYISFFTFSMLVLVTANNFLQLFIGWEGVGLASYLLIGFWYTRESAIQGSLKAFLVNRVGDFGFLLGIALILAYMGSLDYAEVFSKAPSIIHQSITLWGIDISVMTLICILLFVGAMGKSAQMPLHVWLPESMEGPTPISALIHAATMVTAGIFMVARMSPLYEYTETARTVVLVVGATGALFTGLVAIVMNDIKRVVAYSTLSQLGYMIAALGVSAYSVGIFHLVTHAFFKAVLFLGAGSVIVAMHHEQDMRKMGGLAKYMPITYVTYLIGSLALCAIPPFAGFYSKETIIEAIAHSHGWGTKYAYVCVSLGAFVTALYTFRSLLMTFHGKERMDEHTQHELKESPWTIWLPLVLLAIPSVISGFLLIEPMLYSEPTWLSRSLFIMPEHDVVKALGEHYHGAWKAIQHAWFSPVFWLTIAGIVIAWICYGLYTNLPSIIASRFSLLYNVLLQKYGFDALNDWLFVRGTKQVATVCSTVGDDLLIDKVLVDGTGVGLKETAAAARRMQTGYLNHYVGAIVIGLFGILAWILYG